MAALRATAGVVQKRGRAAVGAAYSDEDDEVASGEGESRKRSRHDSSSADEEDNVLVGDGLDWNFGTILTVL